MHDRAPKWLDDEGMHEAGNPACNTVFVVAFVVETWVRDYSVGYLHKNSTLELEFLPSNT